MVYKALNYIWPFGGNCEAEVAPHENEFDTTGVDCWQGSL